MLIIGVDPGSRTTACGIIDLKTKKYYWELDKINQKLKQEDKILEIFNFMDKVIKNYKPNAIAVETPFYSVNIKSAMVLSEIKASIILAAKIKGVEVYQYTPRQIKQAICGYGAADKNQIRFVVEKTLNINLSSLQLDISDAFAIALTHIYTHNL